MESENQNETINDFNKDVLERFSSIMHNYVGEVDSYANDAIAKSFLDYDDAYRYVYSVDETTNLINRLNKCHMKGEELRNVLITFEYLFSKHIVTLNNYKYEINNTQSRIEIITKRLTRHLECKKQENEYMLVHEMRKNLMDRHPYTWWFLSCFI